MEKYGHIVLFPFMAQGHIIPFLSLASLIEQRYPHLTISFVSTPLNIQNLTPSLPPNSAIHLSPLPFPTSRFTPPPGIENLEVAPPHLFLSFFYATETLKPSFESLLSDLVLRHGRDRLCVIADPFLGWTADTANKLNVFHSVFATGSAYGSAIMFTLWTQPPDNIGFGCLSDEIPLTHYPDVKISRFLLANSLSSEDGMDPLTSFLRKQFRLSFKSDSLLVNTVEELEETGIGLLRRWPGLPVWSIGPIIRPPSARPDDPCLKWLDSKPDNSVLYISFGSQFSIPVWEMMDLAMGLEASGRPFIWVIKPPSGFKSHDSGFRSEWLPKGFEERMKETKQGILVRKWAPQLEILSHGSTGAFLSHCGWNSVVEGLSEGVPLIGWSLVTDQHFNAKMLGEEMGVCVEMERGRGRGWEGVARVIELVMGGGEKGEEMRRKGGEIREVLKKATRRVDGEVVGSSVKALEDFLHTALSIGKKLRR